MKLLQPLRALVHGSARAYAALLRGAAGVRHKQLVVCGYPRGGTSLLYNMLSTTLPSFRFERFERPAMYRLHRLGNIASKYPLDVLNLADLPALNVLHKELCMVAVIRDLRDVITSRHPMVPDRYFIGWDHSWWPVGGGFERWVYDAAGVQEVFTELEALRQDPAVPLEVVRYEALVADPASVQARLAERFGLEFRGRFEDFHRHREKMAYEYAGRTRARDESMVREDKPADASRAGKWRHDKHRDRIREQFSACPALFDMLIAYGYETDRAWFDPYRA